MVQDEKKKSLFTNKDTHRISRHKGLSEINQFVVEKSVTGINYSNNNQISSNLGPWWLNAKSIKRKRAKWNREAYKQVILAFETAFENPQKEPNRADIPNTIIFSDLH